MGPRDDDFELLALLFIVSAFIFPTLPAALSGPFFYVFMKCWCCPFQYVSDVWCMFVDSAFCISAPTTGWKVYLNQRRMSLTRSERDMVLRGTAVSARPLLSLFYLGAGLCKHNADHMSKGTISRFGMSP